MEHAEEGLLFRGLNKRSIMTGHSVHNQRTGRLWAELQQVLLYTTTVICSASWEKEAFSTHSVNFICFVYTTFTSQVFEISQRTQRQVEQPCFIYPRQLSYRGIVSHTRFNTAYTVFFKLMKTLTSMTTDFCLNYK